MTVSSREEQRRKDRRNLAQQWLEEQGQSDSATCIRIPDGMEQIKLKLTDKDPLKWDFLPFIAGKHCYRCDEGMEAIKATYELHWIPTLSNRNRPVACRAFCFKKKCAVCDWIYDNQGDKDKEKTIKSIRAKRRHLWLVTDKPGTKNPPLKIFDSNDKNQGKGFVELMADAVSAIRNSLGDDVDPFSLEDGYTTFIIAKELSGGDFQYTGATRIDFRKRDYSYPSSTIDNDFHLDDCIIDPGYDEVMETLEPRLGKRTTDDDEDRPAKAALSRTILDQATSEKEDDEEQEGEKRVASTSTFSKGDKVIFEKDICTIKKVDETTGKLVIEDPDGIVTKNVDPSECEMAEEEDSPDEEEETTTKTKSSRR